MSKKLGGWFSRHALLMGAVGGILAGWLTASSSTAAIISLTTLSGTNGADHYVSEHNNGGGTGNYGDFPEPISNSLFARLNTNATLTSRRHEATYLRFDLSSIPATEMIIGATLQLYQVTGNEVTYDLFGLNDGNDSLWNKATITYNTAPGMNNPGDLNPGTYDRNTAALAVLGSFLQSTTDNQTKSFSSSAMATFLNTDTNGYATFILESTSTSSSTFRSSNGLTGDETSGAHAPRLVLETVTVPEPASGLLVGIALMSLTSLRSRRRR